MVSISKFMGRKRVLVLLAFLAVTLGFEGTSAAYERIVSLSPQITESLYLLKAEKQLLAVTTYCKRPKEAMLKEKIGSPLRPDIEKLISLQPDLILGSREGNPPWIMERLRRLGLRVVYFDRPHRLEGLLQNFLQLSSLVGASDQGKEIVAKVREALSKGEQRVPYKVLWEVDAEPLMAASTASFANDIIRLAGGTNIIDSELPYPRINREEVILKAPDVIVLMDMGYSVDAEMKRWRKYVSDSRFVVMDSYITGSPNPVTFLRAMQDLEAAREK
ncbi:MAG TPA: helical backbone metal receptor [Syntrophorhabdales bacterium]|nr:helical backbone metal receptor [Syntrophorhabdales bacterium]